MTSSRACKTCSFSGLSLSLLDDLVDPDPLLFKGLSVLCGLVTRSFFFKAWTAEGVAWREDPAVGGLPWWLWSCWPVGRWADFGRDLETCWSLGTAVIEDEGCPPPSEINESGRCGEDAEGGAGALPLFLLLMSASLASFSIFGLVGETTSATWGNLETPPPDDEEEACEEDAFDEEDEAEEEFVVPLDGELCRKFVRTGGVSSVAWADILRSERSNTPENECKHQLEGWK